MIAISIRRIFLFVFVALLSMTIYPIRVIFETGQKGMQSKISI